MSFDQVENQIRGPAGEFDQPRPPLGPETGFQFVRIVLEAGDHLAPVAPRGAPTRLAGGVQHDDGRPRLGQVQSR